MNQEEKIIEVYLVNEDKKDYMVFEFDELLKVSLSDDESQNELKEVFIRILSLMVEQKIKLSFKDNPVYKTGLYIDVCKEYIKELNREISNVAKSIPDELQMKNK